LNRQNFKNDDFLLFFVGFLTNRPFEVNIYFKSNLGANLLPFCLRKSIKIGRKPDPKSNPKFDNSLNRFLMILARFGVPSCGHVGAIFEKKGGGLVKCSCVRCCVVIFFLILVCLGRVWTLFSSDFRGLGLHFSCDVGSVLLPRLALRSGIRPQTCCTLRAGGDTRSVRNFLSNFV